MGKFLEHQDKYSSRISDKINGHNEETDISFYLETSDEAVEKNALKTEVGNIQTETLDKQPGDCIQLQQGSGEGSYQFLGGVSVLLVCAAASPDGV